MRAALALGGLAVALAGCQRAPAPDAWFPLDAGHSWTYRVTTHSGDDPPEFETLVLRTLGRETLDALGGEPAWRRRSDSGVDYWLRMDESGIYRVASKSELDPEPVPDKPKRYVLKSPYAVGTQWQATTTAYLLMRRNEFPREIRYAHPSIPMSYQIEALNQTVDSPAGRFEHCLRVRGTASVHLYADPASGWRDMPLSSLEWYCPGVGLVRMERSEPASLAFLTGGTRVLELQSWE